MSYLHLEIPDRLRRAIRTEAARRDVPIKDLIYEILHNALGLRPPVVAVPEPCAEPVSTAPARVAQVDAHDTVPAPMASVSDKPTGEDRAGWEAGSNEELQRFCPRDMVTDNGKGKGKGNTP